MFYTSLSKITTQKSMEKRNIYASNLKSVHRLYCSPHCCLHSTDIQSCVFQGFSADAKRFVAFFTFFSLQLAQLILSCFADKRPATFKLVYVKVECHQC